MKDRGSGNAVMRAAMLALVASWGATFAGAAVVIDLDQPPPSNSKPANPTTKPTGPSAKSTGKADKKSDTPKIEGMEVARGDRGYLGISVKNGMFRMTFYDQKKKPVAPDVAEAVLRWPVNYQHSDERALLTPSSDGKSLTSEKVIRPPFVFKLYVTLLKADDSVADTYVVDFRQ